MSWRRAAKVIRDVVVSEFSGEIDATKIVWAELGVPAPGFPYVSLQLIQAPTPARVAVRDFDCGDFSIGVSAHPAPVRFGVRLNGQVCDTVSAGAGAAADAALLRAQLADWFPFATLGGADPTITVASAVDRIAAIEALPGSLLSIAQTRTSQRRAHLFHFESVIQVTAWTISGPGSNWLTRAGEYASRAHMTLQQAPWDGRLSIERVVCAPGGPIRLLPRQGSGESGWILGATFDAQVRYTELRTGTADTIEAVSADVNSGRGTVEVP